MQALRVEPQVLAAAVAAVRSHDARWLRDFIRSGGASLFRRTVRGHVALATSLYSVGLLAEAAAEFQELAHRVGSRRLGPIPGAWLATVPRLPRFATSLGDRGAIPFRVGGGVPLVTASV